MTLEEAFRQYLIYITIQFPKSEKTIAGYQNDLSRYFQFLTQKEVSRLDQIDSESLEEYVRILARDHAPASVNHVVTAIRGFHQFLAFRYDEPDPAEYLEHRRGRSPLPVYCTHEEIEKIMAQFGQEPEDIRRHAIAEILYGRGLRVSECASLTMNQVDLELGMLAGLGQGEQRAAGADAPADQENRARIRGYRPSVISEETDGLAVYYPAGKRKRLLLRSKV